MNCSGQALAHLPWCQWQEGRALTRPKTALKSNNSRLLWCISVLFTVHCPLSMKGQILNILFFQIAVFIYVQDSCTIVHVDHQCYSDNFDISHSILKTDLFSILGLDCSLIHTQNNLHSSVKDMININCVFIESLCFAGSRDNWHDLRLANPLYLLRKCLWSVYVIFNLNNEYVTLCRNTAVETISRGTLKQDGCQSWH